MAGRACAEKELDDMLECCICTETFTDPRMLPCIHRFCLKCLLNYGKDRILGTTSLPCPLCRKEFTIPRGGFSAIPKNFLIEKLIEVRKFPGDRSGRQAACNGCSSDEARANETAKLATMYCSNCTENYCSECSWRHAVVKAGHMQTAIGTVGKCDVHVGKDVEVFCVECKLAVCAMCFIESHKTHEYLAIEDLAGDIRRRLVTDADRVGEHVKKTGEVLGGIEKDRKESLDKVRDVQAELNVAADTLTKDDQWYRRYLLSEVDSIEMTRVLEADCVRQELEGHVADLKGFQLESKALLASGTVHDMKKLARGLHDRAEQATTFDSVESVPSSLPGVPLNFRPATVDSRDAGKLLGVLSLDDKPGGPPSVRQLLTRREDIGGVTSLGDDVYVVRDSVRHVEVYDAVTLTLRHCRQVPGLGPFPAGLAACPSNRCLYLSDYNNDSVHRIDLCDGSGVTKWSVARSPRGLSVTDAQNVLVVSADDGKLQEFTTRGRLVREIILQADIEYPRHAVQLGTTDKFLVTHCGYLMHRICLVDAAGAVLASYGGPPGSDLTQMKSPEGLTVDVHGNVLVADQANSRLLVLDQALGRAREMTIESGGPLVKPYSVHYDAASRRLCVGEWRGGRLVLIENLSDFKASRV